MKCTLKIAVEIKRGKPEGCRRPHADEAPEQLASVTEARTELARGYWDMDVRSPTVAARFGFTRPVTPARHAEAEPGAPA